ncbi:MAG: protein kinase [Trebonia sp.]|uniref:serine/threonine-protein kinase n=1 Tax=Trebonia sp. TaxID=2767075 RepID=UPI003CB0FBE7
MQTAGPGRVVAGRYRLSAVIGRGGMGVVWQARDELLSRDVAVKEMIWPPSLTDQEQRAACRRATREAQVAARLNHRNVVRIFDIVEEDGCPWIVMELLPYRSLLDVIQDEGPFAPAEAAKVGLQILAGLRAAHSEGVVHRDVKPANILIGPGNRVVLTDFGIAWAADSPAVTTAGVLLGSPSYIAPERARGGHSGAPGDLWGLGASLYTAVEGHPPFERANVLASITAVVTDELAPATHAGPLWPVLSGLLRKDPDQRLDAAETERLLCVVSAAPAYVVTPAAPSPRRSQGSLAAAVGSAAMVVLAAGGTAVGLGVTRSSQNQPPTSAVVTPPSAAPTHPAAASARPTTPASPHTTARTSPATTSPAYVSHNDDPNPKSHHGHGHSKSSKGQGDNSQD